MTDHNQMYQWRPAGWKKDYLNLASNSMKILSDVYEAGAQGIVIGLLDSPDSVSVSKGEKPNMPVKEISGTWCFIADEQFDE